MKASIKSEKVFPRLINIACDQALIAAYAKGMKLVDAPTFKQGVRELDLPIGQPKKKNFIKGNCPKKMVLSYTKSGLSKKNGMGYTPASSSENMGYLHPVMPSAMVKNSAPQEIEKSMAENQPDMNLKEDKALAEPIGLLPEKDVEDHSALAQHAVPVPDQGYVSILLNFLFFCIVFNLYNCVGLFLFRQPES